MFFTQNILTPERFFIEPKMVLCHHCEKTRLEHLFLSECVLGVCRRQELHALKLLQREEQREHAQLELKLQQQREQMFRHIEQEMTVSHMHHSS